MDWLNFFGTLIAGIALGVQIREWTDSRRHVSRAILEPVFVPSGVITRADGRGGTHGIPFANLRIMNTGSSTVRLERIWIKGFRNPPEQSNDPFGGSELLAPGDEYRVCCTECEPEAWMYVQYRDRSDRRFVFFQFIEVSSDRHRFADVSRRRLIQAHKPVTLRPEAAEDVPSPPDHPGPLRIRLGRRRSPEWLRHVEERMLLEQVEGCIDMHPRLPREIRAGRTRAERGR